jgi:enoyl-CoA hydratase
MTTPEGPPTLVLDGAGGATLTLNRARHLNRLHREDLLALQAHITQLRHDTSLRVVVITGRGRLFCAGFNLQELGQGDAASQDPHLFEHTVAMLEALPVPTICRLNGSVFGGATDLALACDFRVGVQGMELRMPAARLGLHYYPSGLRRYVSRLGLPATAKRLFLLAETLGGRRTAAPGLPGRAGRRPGTGRHGAAAGRALRCRRAAGAARHEAVAGRDRTWRVRPGPGARA